MRTLNEIETLNMALFYILISASDSAGLTPKRSTPRRFDRMLIFA